MVHEAAAAVDGSDTALRWLMVASEVIGLAITAWFVWEWLPERYKLDLRRGLRLLRAPWDAAADRHRARSEMMADVIHVLTYGVPDEWAGV